MPSFLSNNFNIVNDIAYNFEYLIVPKEEAALPNYYVAVPNWDKQKTRPIGWINVKMADSLYIVYEPIRPFNLSKDPVSKYVMFTDYEPHDKNAKYKTVRTLREIQPGSWPANLALAETLIATHPDVDAIALEAEKERYGRDLLNQSINAEETVKTPLVPTPTDTLAGPSTSKEPVIPTMAAIEQMIKEGFKTTLEILATPTKDEQVIDQTPKKPETEQEMRKRIHAELSAKYAKNRGPPQGDESQWQNGQSNNQRKKRKSGNNEVESKALDLIRRRFGQVPQNATSENPLQQQIILQQQQQIMLLQQQSEQLKMQVQQHRPHNSFQLMAPEATNLLPVPQPRQLPAKRPSFEADRQGPMTPNGDMSHKHRMWLEFQRQWRDDDNATA